MAFSPHPVPKKSRDILAEVMSPGRKSTEELLESARALAERNLFTEAHIVTVLHLKLLKEKNRLMGVPIAEYYYSAGYVYLEQARYDVALLYLNKARESIPGYGYASPSLRSGVFRGLGTAWWGKGDFNRSIRHFAEAKEIMLRNGLEKTPGFGILLSGMGTAHWLRRDVKNAAEYFRKSKDIFEASGELRTDGYADLLQNIGVLYSFVGRDADALDYYSKAGKIRDDLGLKFTSDYASLTNNIGLIHHSKEGRNPGAGIFPYVPGNPGPP